MLSVDHAVDGEFGEKAIELVERYLADHVSAPLQKEKEWPVSRTQISGLSQIAAKQPSKTDDFANKQKEKLRKELDRTTNDDRRRDLLASIAFWDMVRSALGTAASPGSDWSLKTRCRQMLPDNLRLQTPAPGEIQTAEQQNARRQTKELLRQWEYEWTSQFVPPFFQRFCAHYLYQMTKPTQGE